jgi:hypothetical protein
VFSLVHIQEEGGTLCIKQEATGKFCWLLLRLSAWCDSVCVKVVQRFLDVLCIKNFKGEVGR